MLKQYKPTLDKLTKSGSLMYSSMNKIPVIIDKAYVLVRGKVLAVVCPGTLFDNICTTNNY